MISWIQNHLIRHGRWIFLTLLGVVIVAFVFTIGNTPGCTSNRSAYEVASFYGYDLNSPKQMESLSRKVGLSAQLSNANIQNDQQFQSQLTGRIALLHLADQIGIPAPSPAALSEFIHSQPLFADEDGNFSRDAMTRFIDSVESNPSIPSGTVVAVLQEDYRIEAVADLLSGPGYSLPNEARVQAQRNQTSYTASTAQLAYQEFTPEIAEDEAALKTYFENNADRYEIAERIQAATLFFAAAKYQGEAVSASDADLRDHFISNRARFVEAYEAAQGETTEASEAPAVQFDDVRELVAGSYQSAQAERTANEAAQAFAYQLYNQAVERDSATFQQLISDAGLTLTPLEPYTAAGTAGQSLPAELLNSAFALSAAKYYSDPYPVDGGYAVLIYEGRLAPELPELATVATRVQADYAAEEKRRLFNAEGERLQAALEEKIEAGTAFEAAAEALQLSVTPFDAFTLNDAPSTLNPAALQALPGMESGAVSPMLQSGGQGIFVYLSAKEVPGITADDADYTRAQEFLQRYSSMTRMSSLMGELINAGSPE